MNAQGTWVNWKDDHLETIRYLKSQGITKFKWSTANDEFVCPQCKQREGVLFSENELLGILSTEFCTPEDEDDRCRCAIIGIPDYYQ